MPHVLLANASVTLSSRKNCRKVGLWGPSSESYRNIVSTHVFAMKVYSGPAEALDLPIGAPSMSLALFKGDGPAAPVTTLRALALTMLHRDQNQD